MRLRRINQIFQSTLRKTTSIVRRLSGDPRSGPHSAFDPKNFGDPPLLEIDYDLLENRPHDQKAYTQGLVYESGKLFESTGLHGQSSLREVDLQTGRILRQSRLPDEYFGEGIAIINRKIIQLTWEQHKAFVYDQESLSITGEFEYSGEGWGLATDGDSLIMSDGTDCLQFRDPETFETKRTILVTCNGLPVTQINDLQYIGGKLYANIYRSNYVISIELKTGCVTGAVDFSRLLAIEDGAPKGVLNGIAYDASGDRLFVTGKLWPQIFEVRLRLPVVQKLHG